MALIDPTVPAVAFPDLTSYPLPDDNRDAEFPAGLDTRSDNKLFQAGLRASYDLADDTQFVPITNYVWGDYLARFNISGVVLPLNAYTAFGHVHSFTQELRLSGRFGDTISYIIGGNYQRDRLLDSQNVLLANYSGFPPNALINSRFNPRNSSTGVFGNVDLNLTSELKLTAGLRYTRAKEAMTGCTTGNVVTYSVLGAIANSLRGATGQAPTDAYATAGAAGGCIAINDTSQAFLPTDTDLSRKEDNLSWRIGLNYKLDPDVMIYGLVSRGYKAGLYPV